MSCGLCSVFIIVLVGLLESATAQAQTPGATPKGEEVFSVDPVVVTAPWPLVPPQLKNISKPPYPEPARAREQQGTVLLLLKVRPDGKVAEVKVQETSGYGILDEAAATAAWNWTFVPATQGPKHVEAWVQVPVKFELK